MRMRFKPYARPELLACDFHVHEPLTHAGEWHSLYARPEQPWHLELGCGKGGFLAQLAPAHPDVNYLGIDITDKVLILAKRKVEAAYAAKNLAPDNVQALCRALNAAFEGRGGGKSNFCQGSFASLPALKKLEEELGVRN